jgi:hypothetical protein
MATFKIYDDDTLGSRSSAIHDGLWVSSSKLQRMPTHNAFRRFVRCEHAARYVEVH